MTRDQANTFFDAAVADGWDVESTYNHELYPVENAATLRKQGWVMHVYRYEREKQGSDMTSVAIWGPDGLAIHDVPTEYDWEILQGKLYECGYCKAKDVETFRVGFAGRCCNACIAEVRKEVEFPGWTN